MIRVLISDFPTCVYSFIVYVSVAKIINEIDQTTSSYQSATICSNCYLAFAIFVTYTIYIRYGKITFLHVRYYTLSHLNICNNSEIKCVPLVLGTS